MRPKISDKAYYRLTIPELSGGVNMRDGISLVADNQLTDCKNMWYKDGMLRTRPGMRTSTESFEGQYIYGYLASDDKFKAYTHEKNCRVIDGVTYFLVCLQFDNRLVFYYYTTDGEAKKSCLEVATIFEIPPNDFTCNIFQHGNDIYCFCSGYYSEEETPFYIYKISQLGGDCIQWEAKRIAQEDIYTPTIAHNGSLFSLGWSTDNSILIQGFDMLEGYNLLGNRCKYICSTVSKENLGPQSDVDTTAPSHRMSYVVPDVFTNWQLAVKLIPEIFQVTISYKDYRDNIFTVTHKVKATDSSAIYSEGECNEDDGLRLEARLFSYNNEGWRILFFFKTKDDSYKHVTESDYLLNNMEIIAPCENSAGNYMKVLNMTFNEWYGGESKGLYGGIHLFLGGNTDEKEKSLVVWSDLEKPLYFSENSYAYVGDKSQKVTAFGKQGETLIIAKEKEMYATKYNSIDSAMSAEEVSNQAIVDIVASEVTFPITQIHGLIGCDCAETMQLCRNRLVWANSNGKVYTLVSASQYNERSIYEVSDMIEGKLKKYTPEELRKARAADWEGHYVLMVKNDMYLMDYNSYGFSNVYSYTKTEDAQVRTPWWIWETPPLNFHTHYEGWKKTDIRSIVSVSGKLYVIALYKTHVPFDVDCAFPVVVWFQEKGDNDVYPSVSGTFDDGPIFTYEIITQKISTMMQTKFFDFGVPTIKKSIPKIEVSFGTNGGLPIKTTILTENIADENEIIIEDPEEQEYSVAYFQNRLIRPANKYAYRVGIKFESEGTMSVDAISLLYKQLGGLK